MRGNVAIPREGISHNCLKKYSKPHFTSVKTTEQAQSQLLGMLNI